MLDSRVTFAGGGLDRAAHYRSDDDRISDLMSQSGAVGHAFWRGKPLLCGPEQTKLAGLPPSSPLFDGLPQSPVFLGLSQSGAHFAYDVSAWQPEILPPGVDDFSDASKLDHPDLPEDHGFIDLKTQMALLSPLDAELAATAKAILGWHEAHGYCARCGHGTEPEMVGWQRKCDACGTRHFPRTDPVVIMLLTRGNSVLMGRSPGWPQGMYSLLAGFVEPGETMEAAARREVLEEVSIQVGKVDYLASQPWPYPASLMFGCHCHATSTDITIDPMEIEEARWFSREEMADIFAGTTPGLFPARPGSIAHFLLKNWLADRLD